MELKPRVFLKCPKCGKESYTDGEGLFFHTAELSYCDARNKIGWYLADANIPPRYASASFDNFAITMESQAVAIEAMRQYIEDWESNFANGNSVALLSKRLRVGKTFLACAVARGLVEKHQRDIENKLVYFVNVTHWLDGWSLFFTRFMRDKDEKTELSFHELELKNQTISELYEQELIMTRIPLLILDDLGEASIVSLKMLSRLYGIVEYRVSHCLPMLLTFNNSWAELEKKYGDDGARVVARLVESVGTREYLLDYEKPKPVAKSPVFINKDRGGSEKKKKAVKK